MSNDIKRKIIYPWQSLDDWLQSHPEVDVIGIVYDSYKNHEEPMRIVFYRLHRRKDA